ncbi:hypothetical protein AAEY27_13980 [Kosakonia sp. BYX6]|uniref:Uncharacterized protein n=1 Tax=Kosakonia calanthes TaxID=3139408 RepID=A0ABZ3B0I5_9ENTR
MPVFRESGGIFVPVNSVNVNDGGQFRSVTSAWINDGKVFKRVFPKAEPVNAEDSPLYDVSGAEGSMNPLRWGSGTYAEVGFMAGRYSENYTNDVPPPRLPLAGSDIPVLQSSVFRLRDNNGMVIPTGKGSELTGTAGTSSADIILHGIADEQLNILQYVVVNGVTYMTGTSSNPPTIRRKEYPLGILVKMEWEWVIGGQRYYYNFPPFTLKKSL